MDIRKDIFLGIDCGATTSKFSAVDGHGECLCHDLYQRPTLSNEGAQAMVESWVAGAVHVLEVIGCKWEDAKGVGLAMPGPYLGYGILGKMPNMPASLAGWHFLRDLEQAIARLAGRVVPTVTANDGQLAGLGEASVLQNSHKGSVLMLAPGSGLGCSFVNADGHVLEGDHRAATIVCHMPAPFGLLGLPPLRCGCGRDWGCFEAYTTLSGLPQMLQIFLPKFPDHSLNDGLPFSNLKDKALALRGLAQAGDPLALKLFDLQAQALGHAVAVGCMAYDPTHVIIGGGLMDKGSTTAEFRRRYIATVKESAATYLWVEPGKLQFHEATLGELSQAVGAALLAMRGQ